MQLDLKVLRRAAALRDPAASMRDADVGIPDGQIEEVDLPRARTESIPTTQATARRQRVTRP